MTKLPSTHLHFAALAADVVCFRVHNDVLEALLGKVAQNNVYENWWAHIGGLIRVEETADEAIDRLLADKAGLKKIYKEQLYTFSAIDRDPRGRVVSVAYISFVNEDKKQSLDTAQVETVWKPISEIKKLAYDHDEITRVAIDRLQSKIMYTDIARHMMPHEFTLSELQKVYEAVLGGGMDKRNFRKRILSLDFIKDTKRTIKKGVMRPASLYTFK